MPYEVLGRPKGKFSKPFPDGELPHGGVVEVVGFAVDGHEDIGQLREGVFYAGPLIEQPFLLMQTHVFV